MFTKCTHQLAIVLAIGLFLSCSKDTGNAAQQKRADEFKAETKTMRFQLVDFYSDKPIDYDESDTVVKAETDLRPYIKTYLPDDINWLDSTGRLVIDQGQVRIPQNDSATLYRNWQLKWDNSNLYLDFVDYYYQPLRYTVSDFSTDGFTIFLSWHTGGAKIYSHFARIQ